MEGALREFGRIDILFNNAGIVTSGTAETTSEETWNATLAINVTAVWHMCKLVLPHMRAQGGGVIVNNGSDWSVVAGQDALPYIASKGAVGMLTKAMALDYRAATTSASTRFAPAIPSWSAGSRRATLKARAR